MKKEAKKDMASQDEKLFTTKLIQDFEDFAIAREIDLLEKPSVLKGYERAKAALTSYMLKQKKGN